LAKSKKSQNEVALAIVEGTEPESAQESKVVVLDGLVPTEVRDGILSEMVPLEMIDGWKLSGDAVETDFIESVRLLDIIEPIIVRQYENGANPDKPYIVVDGRRRLQALNALERGVAPCVIEDRSSANDLVLSIAANANRSPNFIGTAADVGTLLAQGWEEKALAAAAGMKLPELRSFRDIHNKLDERLKQAAREGKINKWSSGMMARHPELQARWLDILKENGKITKADVERVRKEGVAKATAANVPTSLYSVPGLTDGGDEGDEFQDDTEREGDATERSMQQLGIQDTEPKPKVKMSRQDRRNAVLNYLRAAKEEMLRIKAPRNVEETFVIDFINEGIDRLEVMAVGGAD
jgi:ParB-like chromosome segregation protein Spo0J